MNPYTIKADMDNAARNVETIMHTTEELGTIQENLRQAQEFIQHAPIDAAATRVPEMLGEIKVPNLSIQEEARVTMAGVSQIVNTLGLDPRGETLGVVSNFIDSQKQIMENKINTESTAIYLDYLNVTGKDVPNLDVPRNVDTFAAAVARAVEDGAMKMEPLAAIDIMRERVNTAIENGQGDHAMQMCAELRAAIPNGELKTGVTALCDALLDRGFKLENADEVKVTAANFADHGVKEKDLEQHVAVGPSINN